MRHLRKTTLFLIAIIVLVAATGFSAQPAQAAGCSNYHVVRHGETLSWIGRYYGINWYYLAQINHIAPPKYVIYTGQWLCIPTGGNGGVYPPAPAPSYTNIWNYSVVNVEKDTTVRIRTSHFPDNVLFDVSIGMLKNGAYEWIKVADLDSGKGGSFTQTFNIPPEFVGKTNLLIRLTQAKKNVKVVRSFSNVDAWYGGCGYTYPTYCCTYNPN